MKTRIRLLSLVLLLGGCGQDAPPSAPVGIAADAPSAPSLTEARRGFQPTIREDNSPGEPIPEPPSQIFHLVKYDSPVGKLAAYLSPNPGDGKRHPAIVWITGGDCNSLGELWEDRPRDNDQSAAAYRKARVIMMFPSLRGGNENPGRREGYFGEVEDVLAAAKHLANQDYVDPDRIYLGGHSTGGTLVMLVAESSNRFRNVFSFGPADDVRGYDPDDLPFDAANSREAELRSPGHWLGSVSSPLFVIEGAESPGNLGSLQSMAQQSTNPNIQFVPVKGLDHFSILAPMNELIATKILGDDGPTSNISFSESDLSSLHR